MSRSAKSRRAKTKSPRPLQPRPRLPLPPEQEDGATRREAIERGLCCWDGGKITAVTLHRRSCCGKKRYRLGFCREHYARVSARIQASSLIGGTK